jgi:outer membrane biosynthesis protein TonB
MCQLRIVAVMFLSTVSACSSPQAPGGGFDDPVARERPNPPPRDDRREAERRTVTGSISIRPREDTDEAPSENDAIHAVIRRHLGEVRRCYQRELVERPTLAGRVIVEFVIEDDGRVYDAAVAESDLAIERAHLCIIETMRRWIFEEVPGEDALLVRYPFVFSPETGP